MDIVIFKIADKVFGLDIHQVRRVIRKQRIIPIPNAASFVAGVISLRGKVVPVIHLAEKFGLAGGGSSGHFRIIVTQIGEQLAGILVDMVSEVRTIASAEITPPDDVLKDAAYLKGVVRIAQDLVLLVDIEKVLNLQDQEIIGHMQDNLVVKAKHA